MDNASESLIIASEYMSDKGYELGSEEGYKKFVEKRNESLNDHPIRNTDLP